MRKLPVFRGYTVDERLEEFRKIQYGKLPQFISFDSAKGRRLLRAMEKAKRSTASVEVV